MAKLRRLNARSLGAIAFAVILLCTPVFAQSPESPPEPTPAPVPEQDPPPPKPEEEPAPVPEKEPPPAPAPGPGQEPATGQDPAPTLPPPAAPPVVEREPDAFIERIIWEGLRRIPRDTMNARIRSRRGDKFNPEALRRDLSSVWNTQFFEDVKIETAKGNEPGGLIVYIVVEERPLIRRIRYVGVDSATTSEILGRFRVARVGLHVDSRFDPTKIRAAEVEIKRLLAERGRSFAKVGHVLRRVPPNALILTFTVEEGPKVKVGKVTFRGNRAFSGGSLARSMKHSRPLGIPPFFYFINRTYNERKVLRDIQLLEERFHKAGYFRVNVSEPETRVRDTQPWLPLRMLPFWFKDGKAMDLRFTITEGGRYRMGDLEVISEAEDENGMIGGPQGVHKNILKIIFPIRKGDLFDVSAVREALEDYQKLYAERGFISANVVPDLDVDDDARLVNLTLDFEPNKQFIVHRIEFTGNTTTRDKVIRRQILLEEGRAFNSRLWETSILRLNQLGYFERLQPESAEVRQNAEEGTVDLNLRVKERGRNSIGFNGGTSGVFGSFVGLNYSTNNFLGLGETLSVDFQLGDRNQAFVVGFTEPYLFDRPLQTGITFTRRKFEFDQARQAAILGGSSTVSPDDQLANRLLNYDQNSTGISAFMSYPVRKWGFARVGLTYSYNISDIKCNSEACNDIFNNIAFTGLEGPSSLNGITSSRLGGTFLYNTVDHPLFPRSGTSIFLGASLEGGVLGGNQKTIRPTFEFKHFRPMNKGRHTLAMRFLTAFVTGYEGFVPSPFSRFFMGGEQDIRGFNNQRITPMAFLQRRATQVVTYIDATRPDRNGNPSLQAAQVEVLTTTLNFPGGDTQGVLNIEYRIPLVEAIILAPFFDIGINTIMRPSQLRLRTAALDDLRQIFPGEPIPDSLRLVPGTNGQVRSSGGLELVLNLPVLQAPFRFYWAYNFNRLTTNITRPGPVVVEAEGFPLPPGVLEQQIIPNLLNLPGASTLDLPVNERLRTFRFTISRTF